MGSGGWLASWAQNKAVEYPIASLFLCRHKPIKNPMMGIAGQPMVNLFWIGTIWYALFHFIKRDTMVNLIKCLTEGKVHSSTAFSWLTNFFFYVCMCAFKSILTSGECLDKSLQFSFSEAVCHCLFPRAGREWLSQGHTAGFMLKVGLEPRGLQSLAWCLNLYQANHYIHL